MSNKTISINTSFFNVGGSKTKKNREKKNKPSLVPVISPNVLKNKLLKRIKEHKQKENQKLEIDKNKIKNELHTDNNNEKSKSTSLKDEILNFSDEFTDSINYLQTLSKQKHINNEKNNYELEKQRLKQELERKTIKNYTSLSNQPIVNIDLPDELVEPILKVPILEPLVINSHKNNDVPYFCFLFYNCSEIINLTSI